MRPLVLALALRLRRAGAASCAAAALCVLAALVFVWARQGPRAELAALRAERTSLEKALRQPAPPPAEPPAARQLAAFYGALADERHVEQQVRTLFSLAAKNGLTLAQAEYRLARNKEGRFGAYQVTLPLRGTYDAVRAFSEQLLLAMPFASLDAIQFRREAIGSNTVESRLRVTIHLAEGAAR